MYLSAKQACSVARSRMLLQPYLYLSLCLSLFRSFNTSVCSFLACLCISIFKVSMFLYRTLSSSCVSFSLALPRSSSQTFKSSVFLRFHGYPSLSISLSYEELMCCHEPDQTGSGSSMWLGEIIYFLSHPTLLERKGIIWGTDVQMKVIN